MRRPAVSSSVAFIPVNVMVPANRALVERLAPAVSRALAAAAAQAARDDDLQRSGMTHPTIAVLSAGAGEVSASVDAVDAIDGGAWWRPEADSWSVGDAEQWLLRARDAARLN